VELPTEEPLAVEAHVFIMFRAIRTLRVVVILEAQERRSLASANRQLPVFRIA
jgi:hypothetical protein